MSYYDDVLSSAAICSCCFGLKQIETDGGETLAYHPTSEIDYVPSTTSSNSRTTFCECGVQGAFDRTWTTAATTKEFREYAKRLMFALEHKGSSSIGWRSRRPHSRSGSETARTSMPRSPPAIEQGYPDDALGPSRDLHRSWAECPHSEPRHRRRRQLVRYN